VQVLEGALTYALPSAGGVVGSTVLSSVLAQPDQPLKTQPAAAFACNWMNFPESRV
jgi:hypothetical protein